VDPLFLLFLLASTMRVLLLTIASLTAICTKSPGRRKVAFRLVCLMLTPPWRRGGERDLP
jgi:hypothetical protein